MFVPIFRAGRGFHEEVKRGPMLSTMGLHSGSKGQVSPVVGAHWPQKPPPFVALGTWEFVLLLGSDAQL